MSSTISVTLGMVGGDGIGDFLEQDRLSGSGLGDDQAALALADGREQVHDAHGEFIGAVSSFEDQLRLG